MPRRFGRTTVSMAKPRLKLAATAERLRESLWLIPGGMVAAAVVLGSLLVGSTARAPAVPFRHVLLPATAEAAVPVLQVVSGSVITVTSVVFSLTVVALQITAGNYSPRALRTFLRDFGTQLVLGTFLATFAYSYVVLQNVRPTGSRGSAEWAPQVAFLAVPVFVLASLAALVFFIHHVTQAVRVELILREVLAENLGSVDTAHPAEGDEEAGEHPRDVVPDDAVEVESHATGFVESFDLGDLVATLERHDLVAAFRPSVGDHVVQRGTLAWVWRADGSRADAGPDLAAAVRDAVQIGRERSMDQDVAYGIRQLVDVAVRALSPGVSDPNTAVAAVLHLTVVYRKLLERRLGPVEAEGRDGTTRVVVPYPSFAEYLGIMVQQVGHYGRADVMVVLRLLRELAELKSLAPPCRRAALDDAIDAVVLEAEQGIDVARNLELVRDVARDAKEQTFRFRDYTAAG